MIEKGAADADLAGYHMVTAKVTDQASLFSTVSIEVQIVCSTITTLFDTDVFKSDNPPLPRISKIDSFGKVWVNFDRDMDDAEG